MWAVLRLMMAVTRLEGVKVLESRVARRQNNLRDADNAFAVEALQLRLAHAGRRIHVIILASFDLRKKSDFGIEVTGGNGRRGGHKDRGLQAHDALSFQAATQLHHLLDQRVQQMPEKGLTLKH